MTQRISKFYSFVRIFPDTKVRGANMGPIWGRQDPGGPHVGPMNFAIWVGDWLNLFSVWYSSDPSLNSLMPSDAYMRR